MVGPVKYQTEQNRFETCFKDYTWSHATGSVKLIVLDKSVQKVYVIQIGHYIAKKNNQNLSNNHLKTKKWRPFSQPFENLMKFEIQMHSTIQIPNV